MHRLIRGTNLSVIELAKLVADMRMAQMDYFRRRQAPALRKAKALEAEVDQLLDQILAANPQGDSL